MYITQDPKDKSNSSSPPAEHEPRTPMHFSPRFCAKILHSGQNSHIWSPSLVLSHLWPFIYDHLFPICWYASTL